MLAIQRRAALAIGLDERRRGETVLAMLESNARRAPGYWIQLFLAMAIATLGLVLGSTAVVIGAMLVSPLMGPIVELGMGLAVGSSLLVIRAFVRVAMSVVAVVAGAAFFTVVLPFHEVTAEIAARTTPTALDLLVAVFCALVAAYTTVRPGADTTAAAAGTAIGIALVPPLCVVGFGIGTLSPPVAGGASLLFTANVSAILFFAFATFYLLGYSQVDATKLEERSGDELSRRTTDALVGRAHRGLRALFTSRFGFGARFVVPLLIVGAVYLPLRQALGTVAWEVRSRNAVRSIVDDVAPGALRTRLTVERRTIALTLLDVGTALHADSIAHVLEGRILDATGVRPSVSVVAVPDAGTLRAVIAARADAADAPPPAPPRDLDSLRATVGRSLADVWPAAAGPILGWELAAPSRGRATLTVRHVGEPLGTVGTELLARSIAASAGGDYVVADAPLPSAPVAAVGARGRDAWVATVLPLIDALARADSGRACVTGPTRDAGIRARLDTTWLARHDRLEIRDSAVWTLRVATGACAAGARAAKD